MQAENEVTAYSKQGLNVWTLARYDKLYQVNNQTFQILDMVVVLSIIVMVVCLVFAQNTHNSFLGKARLEF